MVKNKNFSVKDTFKVVLHSFILLLFAVLLSFLSLLIMAKDISYFKEEYFYAAIGAIVTFVLFMAQYVHINFLQSTENRRTSNGKQQLIIFITMFITVLLSLAVTGWLGNSFALPLALVSILVSVLVGRAEGIIATILTAMMIFLYMLLTVDFRVHEPDAIIIEVITTGLAVIMAIVEGIMMIFIMKNGYTRVKMIWGSIVVAICMTPFAVLCSAVAFTSGFDIGMTALWSFVGSLIAIALAFILLPGYEYSFNVWTDFKTAEQWQ